MLQTELVGKNCRMLQGSGTEEVVYIYIYIYIYIYVYLYLYIYSVSDARCSVRLTVPCYRLS